MTAVQHWGSPRGRAWKSTDGSPGSAPVTLDALSAHWRSALFAAHDALAAVRTAGSSVHFDAAELRELEGRLVRERAVTGELLEAVAQEEHIELHHRLEAPRATIRMLGLPTDVLACLFDLDGVLTQSAEIHAAAWGDAFDELLARRQERTGERFALFRPFDARTEYWSHLHARPRLVGARAFLASRGISLPEGTPDDPAGAETVYGLANRKNQAFQRRLEREGVRALAGSSRYLEAAREAGLRCAVLSPSSNTEAILERSGLVSLIDGIVDGNSIRRQGLESKPAPDTILVACDLLGVPPESAATFETTIAGLDAGRSARVAFEVGVDRAGRAGILGGRGADVVVTNLNELLDPLLAR